MRRLVPLVALAALAACADVPNAPILSEIAARPSFSDTPLHQVFTSGAHVTTWDPILPAAADPAWTTTVCTSQPQVGPKANWVNQHNAFVTTGHPWANYYFSAPWINSWSGNQSVGPDGHNWTKYRTEVSGDGAFVIKLLADNCSWIYLDGILVGRQPAVHNSTNTQYGLTLNGTHTLEFIIFDGGGAAGGKFILETTTNPPPALNPDLDGDGHPNTHDAFPLDPTEWADSDGDGVGDNGDAYPQDPTRWSLDADNDGVADDADNCPTVSNANQADLDTDGVGDACDPDVDGDGVANGSDAFPTDPAESADSDGDGVGNNADPFDNSNTGPALLVGACIPGVANWDMGGGTWANDLIAAAYAASAGNHGAFVRAVTALSNGWKKSGQITGREHGAIVSCAARTK